MPGIVVLTTHHHAVQHVVRRLEPPVSDQLHGSNIKKPSQDQGVGLGPRFGSGLGLGSGPGFGLGLELGPQLDAGLGLGLGVGVECGGID